MSIALLETKSTNAAGRGRDLMLPLVLVAGLALIVLVAQLPIFSRYETTLVEMLIRVAVVVGIYSFVGTSGILSFGHIGFMCIGAYGTAWATTQPMWKQLMLPALPELLQAHSYHWLLGVAFGAILAAVVAVVVGIGILRLNGASATIATFAFLMIVNSLYSNWEELTAGTSSVVGIPAETTAFSALVFAAIAIVAVAVFQSSRFGLMLKATRDEPVAAAAIGIRMFWMRLAALTLSAAICGMSGAVYAHFLGFLSPDSLYMTMTFITLSMLIIGGMRSLSGAVMGVIVVTIVVEFLRAAEAGVIIGSTHLSAPAGIQELGLALMLTLVLVLRPRGLLNGREVTDFRKDD